MTREEEIIQAADECYPTWEEHNAGFYQGAEWADQHPRKTTCKMPKFKIGDKISNGKIQYTVLDIQTNSIGDLSYVFKHPIRNTDFMWVSEEVDKLFELVSTNSDSFDWQSFRAEAAKDILCAMINRENQFLINGKTVLNPKDFVEMSIQVADKLIAKLKEKEEK